MLIHETMCWRIPNPCVRSLFYSYNTYIVIVCPIEAHYFYCCAIILVLLYYWCRMVSFHCSCILWTHIYTKELLSFGSSCLCEFMLCIRRLPPRSGLLSDILCLSSRVVLILKFLWYFGIWFLTLLMIGDFGDKTQKIREDLIGLGTTWIDMTWNHGRGLKAT